MAPGELVQQPISWSGAITGSDRTVDWGEDGIAERFDVITKVSILPGDVVEVVATSSVFSVRSVIRIFDLTGFPVKLPPFHPRETARWRTRIGTANEKRFGGMS